MLTIPINGHFNVGQPANTAVVVVITYSCGSVPENNSVHLQNLAQRMYYYCRLVSIMLNFLFFSLALYFNHLIRSKGLNKTPAEIAINTLCRRMMYYPLVQVKKK